MDAKRHPLPPHCRPVRMGQPYHGLLRSGVLTLTNGKTITWPLGPMGDCYKLQVPGVSLSMTEPEIAIETAAGREWRSYALLSGRSRDYAGITVGADAWLYAASDGTVWRISCEQLNNASVRPIREPDPSYGFYPETLDFVFHVARFGVISPDANAAADTATVTVFGQPLGGRWASDRFSAYPYAIPDSARRFCGDGMEYQYAPINIDDVNSRGSKVLFCFNRSGEQTTNRLQNGQGRAVPLVWWEVSVTGAGAAANIGLSMSLVRMQSSDYGSTAITKPISGAALGMSIDTVPAIYTDEGGDHQVGVLSASLGSRYGVAGTAEFERVVETVPAGRCAGGYYDGSDVLCWVTAGKYEAITEVSGSGSVSYGAIVTESYVEPAIHDQGPWSCIRFNWPETYSATASHHVTVDVSVDMGGNTLTLPSLVFESTATMSETGPAFFELGMNVYIESTPRAGRYTASMSGVFPGSRTMDRTDHWWDGAMSLERIGLDGVDWSPSRGAAMHEPNLIDGLLLSSIDNISLVRVTNRVYAIIARQDWPAGEERSMVVALGSPEGWVTINAPTDQVFCSYNPGTRQLAYDANVVLGWV